MRPTLRTLLFALASSLVLAPGLVTAQGLFSPAYIVNDKVVTNYEIDQRAKLLALLRAPGDPVELARKQLVEERLKIEAAQALGLTPKQDEIEAGMAEFAGRVNLDTEQFLQA
ncbi:MAG: peptidylprolyl isomerase, partial [Rhodobacteraceae bacterium]|nr:peptidylprolyl isomerase [Paracoccaceae bacterium]